MSANIYTATFCTYGQGIINTYKGANFYTHEEAMVCAY
jgi:hypothetical protein